MLHTQRNNIAPTMYGQMSQATFFDKFSPTSETHSMFVKFWFFLCYLAHLTVVGAISNQAIEEHFSSMLHTLSLNGLEFCRHWRYIPTRVFGRRTVTTCTILFLANCFSISLNFFKLCPSYLPEGTASGNLLLSSVYKPWGYTNTGYCTTCEFRWHVVLGNWLGTPHWIPK